MPRNFITLLFVAASMVSLDLCSISAPFCGPMFVTRTSLSNDQIFSPSTLNHYLISFLIFIFFLISLLIKYIQYSSLSMLKYNSYRNQVRSNLVIFYLPSLWPTNSTQLNISVTINARLASSISLIIATYS